MCFPDDTKYLPPREVQRADVVMNALQRIKPQDFNLDQSSSPSKNPQVCRSYVLYHFKLSYM